MEKKKRIFLFAAFDPKNIHNGVIDDSLIMYVRELSTLGDVVFFMDNDAAESELTKIAPFTLHACATRHGEYDFGSYKRAYLHARDNKLLDNYDWLYLVNDSVYAPLHPLRPVIETLESKNADVTGMIFSSTRRKRPHIQSWFIGTSKKTFLSNWFDKFLTSVVKEDDRRALIYKYEIGFSELCRQNGANCIGAHYVYSPRDGIFTNVKGLFDKWEGGGAGMPFMKKKAFTRRYGAFGRQVLYVLDHIDPNLRNAIIKHAQYLYGVDYVRTFLTNNVLKILYRKIRHALYKLLTGRKSRHTD